MDKETLSNYGWVVICVLVLCVMISLATPFGNYVATAVKNTTTALTATADKQAENAGGILDIINPAFEFDTNNGSNQEIEAYEPGLYQTGAIAKYKAEGADAISDMKIASFDEMVELGIFDISGGVLNHTPTSWISTYASAPSCTLEGDLFLPQDKGITSIGGAAFGDCYGLTGIIIPYGTTEISSDSFNYSHLNTVIIPSTVTHFHPLAFHTDYLENIIFEGTISEWNLIIKDEYYGHPWNYEVPATHVQCTDGQVSLG